MNAAQIKHMVERFLGWELPKNFNPDGGITCKRPNYAPNVHWAPVGTNLFDMEQATAMVEYMLEELPDSTLGQDAKIAEIGKRHERDVTDLRAHVTIHDEWCVKDRAALLRIAESRQPLTLTDDELAFVRYWGPKIQIAKHIPITATNYRDKAIADEMERALAIIDRLTKAESS